MASGLNPWVYGHTLRVPCYTGCQLEGSVPLPALGLWEILFPPLLLLAQVTELASGAATSGRQSHQPALTSYGLPSDGLWPSVALVAGSTDCSLAQWEGPSPRLYSYRNTLQEEEQGHR